MDLYTIAFNAWSNIWPKLDGSVLYVDSAFANIISWSCPGGVVGLLQNRGVLNVQHMDNLLPTTANQHGSQPTRRKATILLSDHIGLHGEKINSIIKAGRYTTCNIVVSIPEEAHILELSTDQSLSRWFGFPQDGFYFPLVETTIRQWMRRDVDSEGPLDVSVSCERLVLSMITHNLFLLPGSASVFPALKTQVPRGLGLEEPTASFTADASTKKLASSIISILDSLNVAEELFAMGDTAKQVARCIVAQSASSSRRRSEDSAAVLIIDRTLDLAAAARHCDNVLDQMYSVLPQRSADSGDIRIDPSILLADTNEYCPAEPCTLAHGMQDTLMDLYSVLSTLSQKDALVAIRKRIIELITRESLDFKVPKILGKVTLQQLQKLVGAFAGQEKAIARHAGLLECCVGVLQSLERSGEVKWEELVGVEKVLMLAMSETANASMVVRQIKDVLPTQSVLASRTQSNDSFETAKSSPSPKSSHMSLSSPPLSVPSSRPTFTIQNVVMLLVFAYSLMGSKLAVSDEDEMMLKDAFMRAMGLSDEPSKPQTDGWDIDDDLDDLLASEPDDFAARNEERRDRERWITGVFEQLRKIGSARSSLNEYRDLLFPNSNPPYQSLLKQVAMSLHSDGPALPEGEDLAHVPYGGTLGTVFSGFRNRRRGNPRGNPARNAAHIGRDHTPLNYDPDKIEEIANGDAQELAFAATICEHRRYVYNFVKHLATLQVVSLPRSSLELKAVYTSYRTNTPITRLSPSTMRWFMASQLRVIQMRGKAGVFVYTDRFREYGPKVGRDGLATVELSDKTTVRATRVDLQLLEGSRSDLEKNKGGVVVDDVREKLISQLSMYLSITENDHVDKKWSFVDPKDSSAVRLPISDGAYSVQIGVKYINIKVVDPTLSENAIAESDDEAVGNRYSKKIRGRNETKPAGDIVRGVPPAKPNFNQLPIALPQHQVPKSVRARIKNKEFENLDFPPTQDGSHPFYMTESNHAPVLKLLQQIEEVQMETDIRIYDLENVTMDNHNRVPGLAEKRPSVLYGDKVYVSTMGSTGKNTEWEGYVHRVEQEQVWLQFNNRFLRDIWVRGMKFHVRFTFTRTPLRRCYQGLDLVQSIPKSLKFPSAAPPPPTVLPRLNIQSLEFNAEQIQAIRNVVAQGQDRSLNPPVPVIVFGPPGTGKTKTLVECIIQTCYHHISRSAKGYREKLHMLALAPSNSAADQLVERLSNVFPPSTMFRLNAYKRDVTTVSPLVEKYSRRSSGSGGKEPVYEIPTREEMMRYTVVVSTCVSSGLIYALGVPKGHFTHFFVDECGQATEPELWVGLAGLIDPKGQTQVVLAGDPKQLGPILRSPIAKKFGLEKSFLERLCDMPLYRRCSILDAISDSDSDSDASSDFMSNAAYKNPHLITKLVRNYRSHPAIFEISNRLFYDGELVAAADQTMRNSFVDWEELPANTPTRVAVDKGRGGRWSERKRGTASIFVDALRNVGSVRASSSSSSSTNARSIRNVHPDDAFPILFHGVRGKDERDASSPSWYNTDEIKIVKKYVDLLTTDPRYRRFGVKPEQIGVIAPYRRQVQKLQKALGCVGGSGIKVASQERRIIIISTVRSSSSYISHDLVHNLGFLRNPKHFNVAITRAKALLIIVGNPVVLETDPCWGEMVRFCRARGGFVGWPGIEDEEESEGNVMHTSISRGGPSNSTSSARSGRGMSNAETDVDVAVLRIIDQMSMMRMVEEEANDGMYSKAAVERLLREAADVDVGSADLGWELCDKF
ncbi:hypothetical protein HK102_013708 [Quaeritorhiza haematococci]|nr:hypothetical protein HK102_013708 [Quaeritorhiza haematococci]